MKRAYGKPILVVHGDLKSQTQNAACKNSDDGIGSNNAIPNPTLSGVPGPCIV